MHLFDASWIGHEGGGIFSIDIHPSGRRLVTAGQDKRGAGLIVVWPIEFLYEENAEQVEPEKYDYLAKIGSSKIINVVRWAPFNSVVDLYQGCRRFACGGDDPTLHVYESTGAMMHLGVLGAMNSAKRTLENYKCIHKLYGHSVDVMHLDWSPDGRYLASCSLDHTIIVWNALNLPERCVTLKLSNGGHSRGVKGLAWDPIGRFLATQSDDSTVKLWQTDSWECVRTFSEPFKQSVGTTLFSRMDWSPDGSFLICPGAINNTGPTAKIIMRKNWTFERDFVGYKKAVSCVRSNSRCFYRSNSLNQRITVSCFATGSRDTSLSVWLIPSFGRPLMVLQNIFKSSILDLAWSDFTLAACSRDGFVKFFKFSEEELGIALSKHEMSCLSERIYGVSSKLYPNNETYFKKSITDEDRFYDYWLKSKKQNNFEISKKLPTKKLQNFFFKIQHQKTETDLVDIKISEETDNFKFNNIEDMPILQKDTDSVFTTPKQKRLLFSRVSESKNVSMIEFLNASLSTSSAVIPDVKMSRLRAYNNEGDILWTVFIEKIASTLATNILWTAFATFDNIIFVYSTTTGRLIFSTPVETAVVHLVWKEKLFFALLKNGLLISWNLDKFELLTKQNIRSLFENSSQQLIGLFLHDLKNSKYELEIVLSDCTHYILSKKKKEFLKIASIKDYLNDFLTFLNFLFDFGQNVFLEKTILSKENVCDKSDECKKMAEFVTEMLFENCPEKKYPSNLQLRFLIAFCAFKLMNQEDGHKMLNEILKRKYGADQKTIFEICFTPNNKENNFNEIDISEFLF